MSEAGTGAYADPRALRAALGGRGYLADDALATAAWLALRMERPLFCEGSPGVGKTALARAMAGVLGGPLLRLQCYEGIEAHQALYDWDFPRQLLHVRAAGGGADGGARVEQDVWGEAYLLERPVLAALRASTPERRAVLLIDEVDRADDEFEALLLEVLADWAITIPELGRVEAAAPPFVVITSNRTRDVHDALKRRCLYQFLDLPDRERERAIVRHHVPEAADGMVAQVLDAVARLRAVALVKPPGVAETIDWVRSLALLGVDGLDRATVDATLSAVVKHADDLAPARAELP
ncbi:AAA family ATPase [Mariniluteicoccus flavus]